jgi:SulP family sulfate permease
MSLLSRFTPDLVGVTRKDLLADLAAGSAAAFMAVPQGVAYALIAGLPPKMGLYAGMLPVIVGSLFRSSRHVQAGPTNAVSLLVGGAVATFVAVNGGDPVVIAATLALMVGAFQVAAGALRLGAVVDYISAPVVLGYITGAAVLIGIGQLPNLSGTPGERGHLLHSVSVWMQGLADWDPLTLAVALGTSALLVILNKVDKRIPGAIVVMALGIAADYAFDLRGQGVKTIADLARVPASLPPLTLPLLTGLGALLPLAAAATVLSLVESAAVGRSLAAKSGDRLDTNREFIGQGAANLAAAFTGGYVVSGSLGRSAVVHSSGGKTRFAGIFSGIIVLILVWVAGPIVDHTPIASLAGLLLVVAWNLIDVPRIKTALKTSPGDGAAFAVTALGCWTLSLDHAIYLGVAISLILFLRRASLLTVSELGIDKTGRLREVERDDSAQLGHVPGLRILHVEGPLFFGSSGELRALLDTQIADDSVQVLILRLRRAQGLDVSTATVLSDAAQRMKGLDQTLILTGMNLLQSKRLERSGAAAIIGAEQLFPHLPKWFGAMDASIRHALSITGKSSPAMEDYLAWRARQGPEEDSDNSTKRQEES